jgi:hypothetical protein
MPKRPRLSPGYLRAVQRDARDWEQTRQRNIVLARDKAAHEAREAEKAAVLADLERN